MPNTTSPIDILVQSIDTVGSPACIGIDPVFDKLPRSLRMESELDAIEMFSLKLLDSVIGSAAAVKPQSACFERYGSKGYAVLEKVISRARDLGFVVILDAKRGDIGSSATHYAAGAAAMGAQFITVSPYMGPSTIEPFLEAGLGVFALARTSNPDSDEIQLNELKDGSCVAHAVSAMIANMGDDRLGSSGLSSLGAVVGATKGADDVRALRRLMPNQMLLVPGVGAQGGTTDDVVPMLRPDASSPGQLGVIVNASRSVIYSEPKGDESWLSAIHTAAIQFANGLKPLCANAHSAS
jgi:orotidine-5'-phosphate decarboxylase